MLGGQPRGRFPRDPRPRHPSPVGGATFGVHLPGNNASSSGEPPKPCCWAQITAWARLWTLIFR